MESGDRDRMDRWLDAALQQYGSAEPRPGLEGRILANLRSEMNRAVTTRVGSVLRWWYTLGATVLTACVVVAFWRGIVTSRQPQVPPVLVRVNPPAKTADGVFKSQSRKNHPGPVPQANRSSSSVTSEDPHQHALAQEPRLQQFPAPRALSEQEQLLATCVASYRHAAIFMAQAQAEFKQKQQQEMQHLVSESNEAQTPE